jgi:uncharacterized membrane protein
MKRFLLPDMLKGLAAFFMVQVHITELFIDPAGKDSILGKVSLFLGGPFAAVVFMLVMGYFIALNEQGISVNALRGIKIFILGFLLNIGLNFHLLLKIKYADWQYDPLQYLFGVDILHLAGLSIIVLSLIKILKNGQAWAVSALFLAIAIFTGYLNEKLSVSAHYFILPMLAGNYSWSYFPIFPWLAYPLAGYFFAIFEKKIISFFMQQKTITYILIGLIALSVIIFSRWGITTTINLPAYYHHTLGYIFWALGLTLLWVLLLRAFLRQFPDTLTGNFFCRIGQNITVFYVIQWLIIGNLATAIFQTQRIGTFPVWVAVIFAATVWITFLYEKASNRVFHKNK